MQRPRSGEPLSKFPEAVFLSRCKHPQSYIEHMEPGLEVLVAQHGALLSALEGSGFGGVD